MPARAIALASVLALMGCGKGSSYDESVKQFYHAIFVKSCVAGGVPDESTGAKRARQTAALDRVCRCTADRAGRDRTADQMTNLGNDKYVAHMRECLAELDPATAAHLP